MASGNEYAFLITAYSYSNGGLSSATPKANGDVLFNYLDSGANNLMNPSSDSVDATDYGPIHKRSNWQQAEQVQESSFNTVTQQAERTLTENGYGMMGPQAKDGYMHMMPPADQPGSSYNNQYYAGYQNQQQYYNYTPGRISFSEF